MIGFLIRYHKILLPIGAAIILAICVLSAYHWAKGVGRSECTAQYEQAIREAQDSAARQLSEMNKGYDSASKKISQIPVGGCVGDASRVSAEWLLKNYIGE
jgi:hypothetical protein